MSNITISEIASQIVQRDNILILFHASPDGDAMGSASALLMGLRNLGKTAALSCCDPVPKKFEYLFEKLENPFWEENQFTPEYIISVDVADINLLGTLKDKYRGKINLAIDHHASHNDFADIDYLDANRSANAEIIFQLLQNMNIDVTPDMASAVYTGITTDTGCFRYRNTTADSHEAAAKLIKLGAAAGDINQRIFETKSRSQMEAEIKILGSMEFFFDSRCAVIAITRALMAETGLLEEEMDSFVSKPREIDGTVIGIALKERKDGGFKISVRTNPPANASVIAAQLGGGGHAGAAGGTYNGNLEETKKAVLDVCGKYLEKLGKEFRL